MARGTVRPVPGNAPHEPGGKPGDRSDVVQSKTKPWGGTVPPAAGRPRALAKERVGRTTLSSSSAMSSGRLFLDRVGRHQSPSPLRRHAQMKRKFLLCLDPNSHHPKNGVEPDGSRRTPDRSRCKGPSNEPFTGIVAEFRSIGATIRIGVFHAENHFIHAQRQAGARHGR